MALEFLWDLEEKFWTGDAGFHRSQLAGEALMVLPSADDIRGRECTLDALSRSERWTKVGMSERHVVELSDDAAILVYSAAAAKNEAEREYRALCSSAYVRHGETWLLAEHRQTPMM